MFEEQNGKEEHAYELNNIIGVIACRETSLPAMIAMALVSFKSRVS